MQGLRRLLGSQREGRQLAAEARLDALREVEAFSREEIVPALERALKTYVDLRESPEETFIETFRRVGDKPFREGVYAE